MSSLPRAQFLLLLVLIGGGGWWLYSIQTGTRQELEREAAALRRQLDAAKRAPRSEERTIVVERLVPTPVAEGSAAPAPPSAAEAASAALQSEHRAEEIARRLDEFAAAEPADAQWGSEMTNDAHTAFRAVAGSQLKSADCRASLCRFVVSSESAEQQRQLANQIAGVGPFAEDVWYRYDTESIPPTTTPYVARHGIPLMSVLQPRAEQPRP